MNHSDTEPDSESYVDCEEATETCYEVEDDDKLFYCEEHNTNICEFRESWPIKFLKCKAMLLPTAVHNLYDFAVFLSSSLPCSSLI